ncbi:MAG: hypothetical protein DRQ47_09715, partial [Gammaproteobacteria bacterium]
MKITVLKKSSSQGLRKFNFSEFQVITILLTILALPLISAWIGYRYASTPQEQPLASVAIASMYVQLEQ